MYSNFFKFIDLINFIATECNNYLFYYFSQFKFSQLKKILPLFLNIKKFLLFFVKKKV